MTDVYLKAAERIFSRQNTQSCLAIGDETQSRGLSRFTSERSAYAQTMCPTSNVFEVYDWWNGQLETHRKSRVFALLLMHVAQGDL